MSKLSGFLSSIAVLILAGCGKETIPTPAPVPVKTETVATQEVRPTWRYSGEIRPDKQIQLAFKEPGYVDSLRKARGADGLWHELQVGDEVPGGAVLAHLRPSDYQASLSAAVGQQESFQGALQGATAELEQARADQTKANLDFERAETLYAVKAMTRPDYDAAVAHHNAAAASVQAALQQIEARRGQLDTARAQIASAHINLGDTNLISPMPGVIVEKDVERGTLVAGGTRAFVLDDMRVVKVAFGVPDNMLPRFRMGLAVPVQVDAIGKTLTGHISQIAASADRASRVFNVEVSVPNGDSCLKEGMIASIQIQQAIPETVPVVPLTALMTAESGSASYSVFTIRQLQAKQIAQLKSVRVGSTVGNSVVIEEGLTPGERIIVNRTNQLNDGTVVRLVN